MRPPRIAETGRTTILRRAIGRARGAKVRIRSIAWPFPVVWEGNADEYDGCLEFNSSGRQFYVDLYTETKVGPNKNVTIQALPNVSTYDPSYWTIVTSPLSGSGTFHMYGPASQLSNALAISNFSYYWFDKYSGSRITGTRKIKVYTTSCPAISNNSCNVSVARSTGKWRAGQSGKIHIHDDHNQKKFLIAHEMGHQIYGMHRDDGSFGIGGSDPYCNANTGGSECTYSTGASSQEHALHSKEWQSCAFPEGFAHFVATDVFNSHNQTGAHFHYYKSGFPAGVNVENGPTGGVTKFMENECSGTDTGYGVELDWLRTFWDYHTNSGSKPNHHQIMDQIQDAHDDSSYTYKRAYTEMKSAANADGYGARWEEMASWNGIDH